MLYSSVEIFYCFSVEPASVRILHKPAILEAGKTYELSCEVIGSHPRAQVSWLEGDTLFSKGNSRDGGNSSVVLSTLKFSPTNEDNGKNLKCRGENTAIPKAFQEDLYHLNVVCKYKNYTYLSRSVTFRRSLLKNSNNFVTDLDHFVKEKNPSIFH